MVKTEFSPAVFLPVAGHLVQYSIIEKCNTKISGIYSKQQSYSKFDSKDIRYLKGIPIVCWGAGVTRDVAIIGFCVTALFFGTLSPLVTSIYIAAATISILYFSYQAYHITSLEAPNRQL